MAASRTTTVRVSGIPPTAVAQELSDFFDGAVAGAGGVYACDIAAAHRNWKSRGFGRVQFESPDAAEAACRLCRDGRLGSFQGASLSVSGSPDDIVARAADEGNRLSLATLVAGVMAAEHRMEVLGSWEQVRVELMPERRRIEIFLDDGSESYRLELVFADVYETLGCRVGDGEVEMNAILLKLRYAPRIYRRISAVKSNSRPRGDRYYICKEDDVQFIWVRSADFSSAKAFGRSCYFCVKLAEGCSAFRILGSFPCSKEMGLLELINGEALPLPQLVPFTSGPRDRTVPFEILFQLNSLIHMQKLLHWQLDSDLFDSLNGLPLDTVLNILTKLQKAKSTCYDPLAFIYRQVASVKNNSASSSKNGLADNLMRCYRVLVTPSKVYFLGPEIEKSNHVVKHFSSCPSDFLRVTFVEEDWSKLPPDALSVSIEHSICCVPYRTSIYSRVLSVLRDGITIGSKRFEFLAFSASQLRNNSVWMFAPSGTVDAQSVRDWMGKFDEFRSVSKCAARMGQLFSASSQTFNVPLHDIEMIPDVEVVTDGVKYCFSDGIGKISVAFANQVAQKCGLSHVPSAFQIRYGGYKGVLAVDRTSFKKLSLRPSMKKFESSNTMLNVTKCSEAMPCYLNREVITLLSTLGIGDEVFEMMQREDLRRLSDMLTTKEAALLTLERLSGHASKTAKNMLIHGYEPNKEPYLSMLLGAYYDDMLADLKSRCRIYVPKARVLIGCMDELGVLNYGQLYVRITLTKKEMEAGNQTFFDKIDKSKGDKPTALVVGKVMVTKNPCLHPGDIRVLEAVFDPRLEEMDLINCVIFPQKGERPHPNECSGGDLDGDLYFVCWDENLIPTSVDKPMDYIGRKAKLMDHEVTLQEIHNFFVHYMINDSLGSISTTHLIHADREPEKARSEKCLRLATLHSMAVDFAKTGAPAEMPRALRPKEFPDFLERWERPMYISNQVLGKLYRLARNQMELDISPAGGPPGSAYDHDLRVDGFEAFLEAAEEYRNQYSDRMKTLMNYYEAEHEDEILTGNIRIRSSYLLRDRRKYGEMKDRILLGFGSLRRDAEGWFEASCGEGERPRMASAWYHVTYHPDFDPASNFLSFPWILSDVLLGIKGSKEVKILHSSSFL